MTSMKVHVRIPRAKAPVEWPFIAGLKPRASTTGLAADLKLRLPEEQAASSDACAGGGF